MSKPDDIDNNVWERALHYWRLDGCSAPLPNNYAAAILGERERCAKVSEENGQPGFTDFVDGYNTACLDIAAAIRKGGE